MEKIQFTKDLSKENRKNGEWLLGYYFRESLLSKSPYYPITNWQGLIGYLDSQYPTYIEFLGGWLKTVPADRLIEAMRKVAKKGYTDYPRPSYFAEALSVAGAVSTFDAVKTTATEVGKDIVDFSATFTKVFLVAFLVGGAVYIYSLSGGKFKFK